MADDSGAVSLIDFTGEGFLNSGSLETMQNTPGVNKGIAK